MTRNEIRDHINCLIKNAFLYSDLEAHVVTSGTDNKYATIHILRKDNPSDPNDQFQREFVGYFSYLTGFSTVLERRCIVTPYDDEDFVKDALKRMTAFTQRLRKIFWETLSGKELIAEEMKKIILKHLPNVTLIDSGITARNAERLYIERIANLNKGEYPIVPFDMKTGFNDLTQGESLNIINKETALLRFYYQKGITAKGDIKHLISPFE